MKTSQYPTVLDPDLVGTYAARAGAGGGFVWDAVLEYRVWVHPEREPLDQSESNDYFRAFTIYEEALEFARATVGAEEPIALVLQQEYISETAPGVYEYIREERITEWPVAFLSRPRRTPNTIPDFLSPDAPANRLDIIRGIANG